MKIRIEKGAVRNTESQETHVGYRIAVVEGFKPRYLSGRSGMTLDELKNLNEFLTEYIREEEKKEGGEA